jgi:hypothetical protein
MPSSGIVALVRTDVSEEYIGSIIRVTRISELETMLALSSNRRTLRSCQLLLVWSGGQSSWLQIQRSRVRLPVSTQPRDDD